MSKDVNLPLTEDIRNKSIGQLLDLIEYLENTIKDQAQVIDVLSSALEEVSKS